MNLIERLRTRASIRRNINTRKSVQEGKSDRLADLLEEAADELESLVTQLAQVVDNTDGSEFDSHTREPNKEYTP